ncbi:MAG: bifunctional glycosyltransferase family 2/GtrA family protein [Oscillospiraceae bacterium]|jgi:glycosyltransferase involved in cell wall biosynthesis|nr:bifunctional glycosyltransferase family 2/GtrA family protein [Oscillospiraceae bacterium]
METPVLVIPAYRPEKNFIKLIEEIRGLSDIKIIVVDDGNGEKQQYIFDKVKKDFGCEVLMHEVNKGKGAGLKTAVRHVLENYGCGIVTADADGQHSPEDILKTVRALEENPDSVILGVRDFSLPQVPFKSRWGNRITRTVFRLKSGVRCSDTQTGLRGIPFCLMRESLDIPGERFEFEMNFLFWAAEKGARFIEVPISTIYIEGNKSTNFHSVRDSAKIYMGIFKFGLSSVLSAAVDLSVFQILISATGDVWPNHTFWSNIAARISAGLLNFALNRAMVFKSKGGAGGNFFKYAVLFAVQLVLSSFLVTWLSPLLPIPAIIIKAATDIVLFFASYLIQKKLVFKNPAAKN